MLDVLLELVESIYHLLYRLSPILILVLIVIKSGCKKRKKVSMILNTMRWVLILVAFLSLSKFILSFETILQKDISRLRVTGSYWWAYWIMIFFSNVFPLALISKRLGQDQLFLLFVSIMMNIGWLLEKITILISLGRDFT